MNNYEKERMKLWREVYVQSFKKSSDTFATNKANSAVYWFDEKFEPQKQGSNKTDGGDQ